MKWKAVVCGLAIIVGAVCEFLVIPAFDNDPTTNPSFAMLSGIVVISIGAISAALFKKSDPVIPPATPDLDPTPTVKP